MVKYIFQIWWIIVWNLFAFLILWHILDVIFWENGTYKLISIFVSIPFLIIIMSIYAKKFLTQLKEISANGKPESGTKNN